MIYLFFSESVRLMQTQKKIQWFFQLMRIVSMHQQQQQQQSSLAINNKQYGNKYNNRIKVNSKLRKIFR